MRLESAAGRLETCLTVLHRSQSNAILRVQMITTNVIRWWDIFMIYRPIVDCTGKKKKVLISYTASSESEHIQNLWQQETVWGETFSLQAHHNSSVLPLSYLFHANIAVWSIPTLLIDAMSFDCDLELCSCVCLYAAPCLVRFLSLHTIDPPFFASTFRNSHARKTSH